MKPGQVKPTVFEAPPLQDRSSKQSSAEIPAASGPQIIHHPTPAFRPMRRPPLAMIEILDDGQDSGELYRVRAATISIGREEGDVVVSHDEQISRKHVEIVRLAVNGEYQWVLRDLKSTNGTFFRVQKTPLVSGTGFLLGTREYFFRPAGSMASTKPEKPMSTVLSSEAAADVNWQRLQACLVRLLPDKSEVVFPFDPDAMQPVLMGSDASQCRLHISDDPAVSPVHAAIGSRGEGLVLEDRKSRNGIWVRIKERRLPNSAQFQIGEQRIRFRVC